MQQFSPNTLLLNRLRLVEELAFEPEYGYQVWAVEDARTRRTLTAKLHADGRIELFDHGKPVPLPKPPTSVPWLPVGLGLVVVLLAAGTTYRLLNKPAPPPPPKTSTAEPTPQTTLAAPPKTVPPPPDPVATVPTDTATATPQPETKPAAPSKKERTPATERPRKRKAKARDNPYFMRNPELNP